MAAQTLSFALVGVLALAGFFLLLCLAVREFLRFHGKMVVRCPETGQPAAVRVDSWRALLPDASGGSRLRLKDCSRWPARRNCGRECLRQIELAPESCLARRIAGNWYRKQRCVLCRKPFEEIRWFDHRPALMRPDRQTVQWHEVPAEKLLTALSTHFPVCWNCHIAETFVREHPELVVTRAPRSGRTDVGYR